MWGGNGTMERKIDPFMVEFAEENQVSPTILHQIYDVMNRYRGKQKNGEKITGDDFIADMQLASYLTDEQISQFVNGMKNVENWENIAGELEKKMNWQ